MRVDRHLYRAIQQYEEMLAQLETANSSPEEVIKVLLVMTCKDVYKKNRKN